MQKERKEKNGMSFRRKIFLLLCLLLSSRIILGVAYLLYYGPHTTPITETYYYYGIAKGYIAFEPYDVTGWILKFLGALFPKEYLLYAVFLSGALISSLTALMVYFFVRDVKDEKTALFASLLYGFLEEPLSMGVLLFTHDLVAMPFLVAFLWSFWNARKKKSLNYTIVAAIVFAVAMGINATIYIALEIVLVSSMLFYLERKEKIYRYVSLSFCALLVGSAMMFFFNLTQPLVPYILRLLSYFSKYEYEALLDTFLSGTTDFTPMTPEAFWVRYNVFLFLVPSAIYLLIKRKDSFGLGFFTMSILSSFFFDRASRVFDLGFALILCDFILSESAREKARHVTAMAIVFTVAAYAFFKLPFLFVFLPLFILLAWRIALGRRKNGARIFMSFFVLTNLTYFFIITGPPMVSEAEYEAYVFLGDEQGVVLSDWGRGFAIKAVSGLDPYASPSNVSDFFQRIVMKEEDVACSATRENGIEYVIVTDQYFKFLRGEMRVSDFYLKYYEGRLEELDKTLLFGMLFEDGRLSCFEKVFEKSDMATNAIVKVFQLQETMTIKVIEKVI